MTSRCPIFRKLRSPVRSGSAKLAGMANDFSKNPGGSGPTPARPRSFIEAPAGMDKQKPYDGGFKTGEVSGGNTAAESPANTPKQDAGNPIGAGSLGNSQKPFSLKG